MTLRNYKILNYVYVVRPITEVVDTANMFLKGWGEGEVGPRVFPAQYNTSQMSS